MFVKVIYEDESEDLFEAHTVKYQPLKKTGNCVLYVIRKDGTTWSLEGNGIDVFVMNDEGKTIDSYSF